MDLRAVGRGVKGKPFSGRQGPPRDLSCGREKEPGMRRKTPDFAEKILAAAARLFGARRFHEVRMEDVAVEAGVSKGSLYGYFPDKERMYRAVLERASRQLVAVLRERVAKAKSARDQLVALVSAVIAYFDPQPHLFDLIQR